MAEKEGITRRRFLQAALGLGVAISAASLGVLGFALRNRDGVSGKLERIPSGVADTNYEVGDFILSFTTDTLIISHRSNPERVLWQSLPGESFLSGAIGREKVSETRAHFSIEDRVQKTYPAQTVDRVEKHGQSLTIHGRLSGENGAFGYTLSFSSQTRHRLRFEAETNPPCNRLYLTYASFPEERFFGFGTQYTYFDLKGKKVPIFIQEQGIGRGAQPITLAAELRAGAGGSWHASYACVPHYITSELRSLFLENREYSAFDLRRPDRAQIEVFSGRMSGQILNGDTPPELIERYTEYSGRMPPLSDWVHDGAILGLQGGTEIVSKRYEKVKEAGAPVAALWLQDWVGQRRTSFGSQLWWNWELDHNHYPGWQGMRARLQEDGVRLVIYFSPFLADVSEKENHRSNLFKEAKEREYLVKNSSGEPYMQRITDFSAALIDLTNPRATEWMRGVIRRGVAETGASGWMADFGEALPYEAVLFSGEDPRSYHNRYAEKWAELNRETKESDELFFIRSGFLKSPGQSTLFWLGDQLVSWDKHDGIKTAVTGLLSSGLSGYSLDHSDTGGYTAIDHPLIEYHRSKELLLRWIELNAFTAVFRTHEGNRPEVNHQIYSDEQTLSHFARFAAIFAALKPYRKELVREAARTGTPVVRHPFIHYPGDREVYGLIRQFMLGREFMVAPVLDRGATSVSLYLPAGGWVHLWSGERYSSQEGTDVTVDAPLGKPAVFYRDGSEAGENLRKRLEDRRLL